MTIQKEPSIFQHTLRNGLQVLIKPINTIPKVAVQLWYNVGSKNEKSQQRGIAHLLEHMLFKGTTKFSEQDITKITHTFGGNCNAFTSCDYTAYVFDFPHVYWDKALDILSDTMKNCTFKQELLNSELKAVIQELKMYNDDYELTLVEQMMGLIFTDHPYRNPIIGSRYDLLCATPQALFDFYHTYYVPNNATLVIVGDISYDTALSQVHHYFDALEPNNTLINSTFHFDRDICQKSITLYRDIQQPVLMVSWVIPGMSAKKEHIFKCINWLLCQGKGSRLYRKLVHEKNKAIDVDGFIYNFFEHSLLYIRIVPTHVEGIDEILILIEQELYSILTTLSQEELVRAFKQVSAEYNFNLETIVEQASSLGEYFLALNAFDYPLYSYKELSQMSDMTIKDAIKKYLTTSRMNSGMLLPLDKNEKKQWHIIQDDLDIFDERILSKKIRNAPLEEVSFKPVHESKVINFTYPVYKKDSLKSGLTFLYYNHGISESENVTIVFDFKVDHTYDPDDLSGLCNFVFEMLLYGTINFTAEQLAQKIESKGIILDVQDGKIHIKCLTDEVRDSLEIVHEMLLNASFTPDAIILLNKQLNAALDDYWDTPSHFADQLARDVIYKKHPYHKNPLGTRESIQKIMRADIISFYKKYITPRQTCITFVGNTSSSNIPELLSDIFGQWQGPLVKNISYSRIPEPKQETVEYNIDRDQTVVCFTGLSVSRFDPAYNALFLFDYILTGGPQGAMSSKLFSLRERTGLFYAISGSIIANADEQPGLILLKAIVSKDDVTVVEQLIKEEINNAIHSVTQQDIVDARNAAIYSLIDIFESNSTMADTFLFLDRFNLGPNFFTVWIEQLLQLTVDDVRKIASNKVVTDNLITLRIGRVGAIKGGNT